MRHQLHGIYIKATSSRRQKQIYLWNPESTDDMGPAGVVCLFEGAPLVGTQGTVHSSTRRLQAAAT